MTTGEQTNSSDKEAKSAFVKEVASQVFVMILPTIVAMIKTATNNEITDERIAELMPKDPAEYFPCLDTCEDCKKE